MASFFKHSGIEFPNVCEREKNVVENHFISDSTVIPLEDKGIRYVLFFLWRLFF